MKTLHLCNSVVDHELSFLDEATDAMLVSTSKRKSRGSMRMALGRVKSTPAKRCELNKIRNTPLP
ncbi:MAG: hypothetical protein KAI66_14345 [Lentisphaeria bacterium]|nr:hypothetical protein [Lentisphaeria bacterium]